MGGVRVQEACDERAGWRADVRWNAVLVFLDLLVSVLQSLCLKRRLSHQQGVPKKHTFSNRGFSNKHSRDSLQ